jgi:hypothetical protein
MPRHHQTVVLDRVPEKPRYREPVFCAGLQGSFVTAYRLLATPALVAFNNGLVPHPGAARKNNPPTGPVAQH